MIKELGPGLRLMIVFTVLTGILYPAVTTVLAQWIFPARANGSLVYAGGKVVGSSLIGQGFSKPEYFKPRPSAAGSGYDGALSAGSNLGPTSSKLLRGTTKTDDQNKEVVDFEGISLRVVRYTLENEIPYESSAPLSQFNDDQGNIDEAKLVKAFGDAEKPLTFTPQQRIPADAVTASSSGLDPHISPANAEFQAGRVAKARGVSVDQVKELIAAHTAPADLGFLGETGVNVLLLNIALDRALDKRFPAAR